MKNSISNLNSSQCCEKIFKEYGLEYTLEDFHKVYEILEDNYYDEDFVKTSMIDAKGYFKNNTPATYNSNGYFAYLRVVIKRKYVPPIAQAFYKLVNYTEHCFQKREIALIEQDVEDLLNELLKTHTEDEVCCLLDDVFNNFRQFNSFEDVRHHLIV